MYDKKQILKEIKRIAEEMGSEKLDRSDFISRTMIPEKTIDFYIISWEDALREAGLDSVQPGKNEITDSKLLEDLVRLFNKYGESPTVSLIDDSGRYPSAEYTRRWRTLEDAMKVAKHKFPEFIEKKKNISDNQDDSDSESSVFNLDDTLVSVNRDDLILKGKKEGSNKGSDDSSENSDEEPGSSDENSSDIVFRTDDLDLDNLMTEVHKKNNKKPKIIPQTVKPSQKKDVIDFRGLSDPPLTRSDVILLFGMVCEELSFIVESFPRENGEIFRGKMLTGGKSKKWKSLKFSFAHRSSEATSNRNIIKDSELLICWKNDWIECPVEILELSEVIKDLENYSPEEE